MQSFAFFVCFSFCFTLLFLPFESQSSATPLKQGNFVRVGNESRCESQCVVVDSDFGKDMKKLITEYKLITLDLTFEQRVDKKCLNQTHLYNVTKPADIWTWLADNDQGRGENVSKQSIGDNGSVTWFRKSFEGQIEVSVLCDFRLTNDPAVNDTRPSSLNDLVALTMMEEVANSTRGPSYSEITLCYKESTKNGSYTCLNATTSKISNVSHSWQQHALGIVVIPITVILMLYSPAILCLFPLTEVKTEKGSCVFVLSGTSPVGIRSWISNLFSTRTTRITRNIIFLLTFLLITTVSFLYSVYTPFSHLQKVNPTIKYTRFIVIFYGVSILFSFRYVLSICFSKLSIRNECVICATFGGTNKPIIHQGVQEELKQHLRIQPFIVVRCFSYCFNCVRKKLKFTCPYFMLFAVLAPIIVLLLLIALVMILVTVIIIFFYSCPLATANAMIVLRCRNMGRTGIIAADVLFIVLLFVSFSPLVSSFCFLVFETTIFSLVVIRGILMRLPGYLPVATLVVVVAFYCWRCYSSFTRKYHNLAIKLYKQHTANSQGEQDQEVHSREDIVPKIPKDLFEKACNELMPLRESISILLVKLISLLTFFFVVFAVIMETPDATDRAKATATFFTALVPKIIEMVFSKDPGVEKLEDELLDKKVNSIVDEYLSRTENRSNGGDTSLENSSNSIYESVENERTELLNDNQIDVQDYRTFGRSRNTDEASSG